MTAKGENPGGRSVLTRGGQREKGRSQFRSDGIKRERFKREGLLTEVGNKGAGGGPAQGAPYKTRNRQSSKGLKKRAKISRFIL